MRLFNSLTRLFGAAIVTTAGLVGHAAALTIDDFNADQQVGLTSGAPSQSFATTSSSAVGGMRVVSGTLTSGAGTSMAIGTAGGSFGHSQAVFSTGRTLIVWDGDAGPALINPLGLGALNLLQDSGDAFVFSVASFDYPANKAVSLEVTVYDSSDPSGGRFSRGSLSLSRIYNSENVALPFASLQTAGPNGAANLTQIGAITLLIDGPFPAVDLELTKFSTNGRCDLVPVQGRVIDQCGVCGGDDSTCKDCAGVPNGPALPGTPCSTGLFGICNEGQFGASCSCVQLKQPTVESCDGSDNDCDALVDEIKDQCGVCGGDGTSCLECARKDLTGISAALDGGAKEQEILIRAAARMLRGLDRSAATREYTKALLEDAHELQIRNWVLSWQLPPVSIVCSANTLCVTSSNEPILAEYRQHANSLRQMLLDVSGRVQVARGGRLTRRDRNLLRTGDRIFRKLSKLADSVPLIQSQCAI